MGQIIYTKVSLSLLIAFLAIMISHPIHAQVGIGTTSPDASAVLDIQSSSNDKGILIPRMTQAQRNAISSPATGLMIFQTDGNVGFYFYDGSSWESFGEVKTVNGNSPAADGNVTLTFLATQTGTQAQRAATASPTDGLVHIVTGDPTPSENDKVYIYSTGLASWTLSSGFTDTDEQDISGSSFTVATSALLIDIEDGSGQTLDLSALEELVNDADPATNLGGASQGDLAYDTTDDELQVYDGTSWVAVSSSVVTPTLDQVTDVGSSTTNGIDVGSLTVNSAFTLPTATGTAGQYLTVSTTTSEIVFTSPAAVVTPTLDQVTDVGSTTTNSIEVGGATVTGDLTVNTNTTLEGNTTIGDASSDDLTITARLDSDLIPKSDDSRSLGSSSLNFNTVNTLNVTSNAGMTVSSTAKLTLNTSATGTPTISLQQGGTEMAGIGSSTFFIGDSTSGNHYFFPSATETSTFDQVLLYSNLSSNTLVWSDFILISPASSDGEILKWDNTNSRWVSDDDIIIDDSSYGSNISIDNSIIPRDPNINLGQASDLFFKVFTEEINSGSSQLTLNTTATGTPTISFQQGGTEIAGIGSSTFFIGDSTLGNHYFFPQNGGSLGNVLAFTSTNTLEVYSVSDLEQQDLDDVLRMDPSSNRDANIRSLVASNTIESKGTALLANGTTDDDINLGNDDGDDLIIEALLQSHFKFDSNNLYDIGTLASNARNIYSRTLISNNNLSINVSSTTNDQIFFEQSGTTKAGVNSSTFYVGRDSNRYEFPEIAPATVNNQVLAYTSTNSLTFTTLATLPTGTSTGTVLRYNPSSSSWEETELLKINPGGTFANNITVSNTLVPLTDNIIDLGKSAYEYRNIFSQKIETGQADLEIETNGNTAYLKIGDSTYGALFLNSIQNAQGLTGNTVFGLRSFNTLLGSAEYNVVLGPDNLTDSNLTGNFNITVGSLNQESNVSGNHNISIGRYTLEDNVTISNLIAIGNEALRNTSAIGNIGIGEQALFTNDSGENNIALGNNSLYQGTSFNSNVAIGNGALLNNNSNNNTAIGFKALDFNTNTGGNNTAIGFGADISSSAITNSTAIGANATVTTSNTIQLGDTSITNVNTSGIVSSTGLIDSSLGDSNELLIVGSNDRIISTDVLTIDDVNDRVGIGTTSPERALHMSSDTPAYSSILVDQYANSNDGPDILLRKARGTISSPTANQDDDQIGKFFFYTHDGTDFDTVSAIMATSVVSSTNFGSRLEFFTTTDEDINVQTATPQFTIKEDGDSEFTGVVSATGFETSGVVTATSVTIQTQLTLSSNATTVAPLELNASALNDGVGALNIDSVEPDINLNDTDGGFSTITFENNGTPTVAIGRNNTDDFYITTGGPPWPIRFTIEDTTGDARFYEDVRIDGNGTVGGTTAITSDKRIKSNIENNSFGLDQILKLQSYVYDKYRTTEKKKFLGKEIGFLAQDVSEVIPLIVKKDNNKEELLSLNYIGLIPILTKAIQDQQKIIDQNQSEINQLKSELISLKTLVEKHLNQTVKE